jgi:ATP-dependent Clp protease ATP-binding subunit ClpA
MRLADQEARRLQHARLGTEHLLLGLVKEGSGPAATVLRDLGVEYRVVRLEVEKAVPAGGTAPPDKLPPTPAAQRAVEHALAEARRLGQDYAGSEHLLLGLLNEKDDTAARVLTNLGLDLGRVRNAVLDLIGAKPAQPRSPPPDAIRSAEAPPAESGPEEAALFQGLSGQARKAVQLAYREARRLDQDCVSSQHLLVGVLEEGSGTVARLLAARGLTPEKVSGPAGTPPLPSGAALYWARLPLTPGVRRALERAREEAERLRHPCVGPDHLVLGMLHEPDGMAAAWLAGAGVTLEGLRQEVEKGPGPENRDWQVQPQPTGGPAAPADPAPRELAAVLSGVPLPATPPSRAPQEPRPAAAEGLPQPPRSFRRADDAERDLRVVAWQLRFLQFAVATGAGLFLGADLGGWAGAVLGLLVGAGVAWARSYLLGALAGAVAGVAAGYQYDAAPEAMALCGVAGLLLGACLGDWRKLPAPPGSG